MAWWELGELVCYSLRDMGFRVTIQNRRLEKDCRNILLGAFLLDQEYIAKIPKNTIILNTEQMYSDDQKSNWPSDIYAWARNFETWDYSDRNIEAFSRSGIYGVKKLSIGFQSLLRRIPKNPIQDIDVLFYGSTNDRRLNILSQLEKSGLNVKILFGVYGKERDNFIARSKVILNCHNYKSEIFEIVRCFYLMTNSKAIVAEVNPSTSIDEIYRNGVLAVPYDELLESCLKVASDKKYRENLEERAIATILKYPQKEFTSRLI